MTEVLSLLGGEGWKSGFDPPRGRFSDDLLAALFPEGAMLKNRDLDVSQFPSGLYILRPHARDHFLLEEFRCFKTSDIEHHRCTSLHGQQALDDYASSNQGDQVLSEMRLRQEAPSARRDVATRRLVIVARDPTPYNN